MYRLKTIVLPAAADMSAARGFYEDGLGLVPRILDGSEWVQYAGEGCSVALAGPREYPAGASGAVVVWQVDDLDAEVGRLAGRGVPAIERRDMGGHGRLATFRDPGGTVIQLFSRHLPSRR